MRMEHTSGRLLDRRRKLGAGRLLHAGDVLVDLGPHVLEGLGGPSRHVDFGPVDGLALLAELGDDSEKELELLMRTILISSHYLVEL